MLFADSSQTSACPEDATSAHALGGAGIRFTLVGSPRQDSTGQDAELLVLGVTSLGINNLPRPAQEALAELFGPVPELLGELLQQLSAQELQDKSAFRADSTCASSYELHSNHTHAPLHGELIPTSALIAQAQKLGYANRFEAIAAQQPWRPVLADGTGLRLNPRMGKGRSCILQSGMSPTLSRWLLPAQQPARSLL